MLVPAPAGWLSSKFLRQTFPKKRKSPSPAIAIRARLRRAAGPFRLRCDSCRAGCNLCSDRHVCAPHGRRVGRDRLRGWRRIPCDRGSDPPAAAAGLCPRCPCGGGEGGAVRRGGAAAAQWQGGGRRAWVRREGRALHVRCLRCFP